MYNWAVCTSKILRWGGCSLFARSNVWIHITNLAHSMKHWEKFNVSELTYYSLFHDWDIRWYFHLPTMYVFKSVNHIHSIRVNNEIYQWFCTFKWSLHVGDMITKSFDTRSGKALDVCFNTLNIKFAFSLFFFLTWTTAI